MYKNISKIPSHYVSQTCAQIMIPYSSKITLINKDGIIFNEGTNYNFINLYLENELRRMFPYNNIPNHITKQGPFENKMNISNQILNFNEHYISISDGILIDRYIVKDGSAALLITEKLPCSLNEKPEYKNREELMTREQLNNFFKTSKETEKVYFITTQGYIYNSSNMEYPDEENLLKKQKENYLDELKKIKSHLSKDIVEFFKIKINNMELSDLQNIPLPPLYYIIKIDGVNIKIQLVYTKLIKSNNYMVTIKDVPLDKYVLEQFKYMAPNITEFKEPQISTRLNPGITKQDITEAKEMVLRMKNLK